MTNPDREELVKLEAERAELIAKNEAATSWGAAVGARSERIKGLDGRIATLRRLASSDGGVKVRELEWGPYPNPVLACDDVAVANTPVFGGHIYQVQRDPNAAGYIAFLAPQFGSLFWESKGHATLEAAKAAAQTDYEARIKSALVEVPAVKGEPEPYAYEYGKSNGDGTYSVVIERPPLRSQVSDRPTKPLYAAQPADAGMREALSQFDVEDYVASYEFRDIGGEAGDHVPTDSERVLITDAIHGAIAEIEAALTAPGATTKSDGGEVITAEQMDAIENAAIAGQPLSNYGEYTPVTVRGSTRVPTLVDDPNSASGKRVEYQRPSDPSSTRSDVTVEELALTIINARRRQNGLDDLAIQQMKKIGLWPLKQETLFAARALLDQFEIRRKK